MKIISKNIQGEIMIFENKVINLPKGDDFMFYPISANEIVFYYKIELVLFQN